MDADRRALDPILTLSYTLALGVLAALYRLAPYYLLSDDTRLLWNMAPVGALALFAGSRLRTYRAFVIPLGVMLVSDLLLIRPLAAKGYPAFTWNTPVLYASFAVYVLVGRLIRQGDISPVVVGLAALLAGVQFFLVSNFAAWLNSTTYPPTFAGLMHCYAAGLPFYRNTLAGDLFFSGMIFGVHAVLGWAPIGEKEGQPA